MVSFFSFLDPANSGLDETSLGRARSQGLLNAAATIANMSAPGFGKAQATPLQLITNGMMGYGQGANNYVDNFYGNDINKSTSTIKRAEATRKDLGAQRALEWFGPNAAPIMPIPNQPMGAPTQPQPSPTSPTKMLSGFYQSGAKPVNNPGNLRPVGASSGFQQFSSPEEGMAALRRDLTAKLTGKSKAMGGRVPTIRNLISVYAPANENATAQLIKNAEQRMGMSADTPLTMNDLDNLTKAILIQEQGGTGAQKYMSGNATVQQPQQMQPAQGGADVPNPNDDVARQRADELYKLGMINALSGDGGGHSMMSDAISLDPATRGMVNQGSLPAAVVVANELRAARAAGDTQRINDLLGVQKVLNKGMGVDANGNIIDLAGFVPTNNKIEGSEAAAVENAKSAATEARSNDAALDPLTQLEAMNEKGFDMAFMDAPSKLARLSTDEQVRAKAQAMDLMRQARLDLAAPLAKQLGVNPTDKDFQASLDRIFDMNSTKQSRAAQIAALKGRIQAKRARNPYNNGGAAPTSASPATAQPKFLGFE